MGYRLACVKKQKTSIDHLLLKITGTSPTSRLALAEGLGECLPHRVMEENGFAEDFGEIAGWETKVPAQFKSDFFRGVGEAFATFFEEEFEKGVEEILKLPESMQAILFEGFGKGTYWWDGGRGQWAARMREKVPDFYLGHFENGIRLAAYPPEWKTAR